MRTTLDGAAGSDTADVVLINSDDGTGGRADR
jgi:hypothetical protein